jgi:hypothetical protein
MHLKIFLVQAVTMGGLKMLMEWYPHDYFRRGLATIWHGGFIMEFRSYSQVIRAFTKKE